MCSTERTVPVAGYELLARWPAWRPFLAAGSACVTVGGVVAAITRPVGFGLGPWTAAYLVLVGGVAQIALGIGQAWLGDRPPTMARVRVEASAWNLGVAVTLLGTWTATAALTTLGGLSLAVALGWFIATTPPSSSKRHWAGAVYRGLALVVLISIPIGLSLAWIRQR